MPMLAVGHVAVTQISGILDPQHRNGNDSMAELEQRTIELRPAAAAWCPPAGRRDDELPVGRATPP